MRVKELIAALHKLDQELEVCCYVEDDRAARGHEVGLVMEILNVEQRRVTRDRAPDGKPTLRFVASEMVAELAVIEVTADS